MKHIYQQTTDLIVIRSFKDENPGILISQKKECIKIERDSLPEIINELIWLSNHKIVPTPPAELSGDKLEQWKRIEHMKSSLNHCVIGYEKKLADKEKNYSEIMRENQRLLTKIENLKSIIVKINQLTNESK